MKRFGIVEQIGLVNYVYVTMNYICSCELDLYCLYNLLVLVDTMFELYMRIYVLIRFEFWNLNFFGGEMYCRGGSI